MPKLGARDQSYGNATQGDYEPYAQFEVQVGSAAQESYVKYLSNGTTLLAAEPGMEGGYYDGGDGYSGGGDRGTGSQVGNQIGKNAN